MSDKGYTQRQGPIEASFNCWAAERTTAVSTAVGQMRRAQTKEIEAETERTDQFTKLDEAHNRRAGVSARFHHEQELNRAKWAEQERAEWRKFEANEVAHQTDLTNRYTALTVARTTFVDAQTNYLEATQQQAAVKKYAQGTASTTPAFASTNGGTSGTAFATTAARSATRRSSATTGKTSHYLKARHCPLDVEWT